MSHSMFEQELVDIALKRLLSCASDRLVPFTWRKKGNVVIPAGFSIRYSAMALIGLQAAVALGLVSGEEGKIEKRIETLKKFVNQVNNYGDAGLCLSALSHYNDASVSLMIDKVWQLFQKDNLLTDNLNETMWLSWLLDGFCAATEIIPDNAYLLDQIREIADKLLRNQHEGTGLFYRTKNWSNMTSKLKCNISFFCDQVYPIHAMSSAHIVLRERKYLDAAELCARRLIQMQGPLGEWWWIYDIPNGSVVERYPVYAVHQHGMGPMALRRLRHAGGMETEIFCEKGISWLYNNGLNCRMVDEDRGVIWRSHRRRNIRRVITTYNQIAEIFGVFPKHTQSAKLEIDWECRPYELGWLLYADSLRIS